MKSINFMIRKTEMENADQCFNQVPQKSPWFELNPSNGGLPRFPAWRYRDSAHSNVRLIRRKVLRKCWATHAQFFLRSPQLGKSFLLLGGVRERKKSNHKFSHISSSSLLMHKNATDFCVLILFMLQLYQICLLVPTVSEGGAFINVF